MVKSLHRIHQNITNNFRQYHHILSGIFCVLVLTFLFGGLPGETAYAATGIKIYDYSLNKVMNYKDKKITVTFNDEKVNENNAPGLLENGISLVPYSDVFEKSPIAAQCSYNAAKKTITISKYGNTVIMTLGTKKASVNGKAYTTSAIPKMIKYMNSNKTEILVPSRFVAENLGIGYNWDSGTDTVSMNKNVMELSYNGGNKLEYTGTLGKVTIDGKNVGLGDMPVIIMNNTAMLRVKKVFADKIGAVYQYNKSDKSITLQKNGNTLVMYLGSTKAQLNGNPAELDAAPVSVKNYKNNISYILVPGSFTAACLGYNYSWDQARLTSIITSKKDDNTSSGNSTKTPELGGDTNATSGSSSSLELWSAVSSSIQKGSEIHELNNSMTSEGKNGHIYTVARDNSINTPNVERFVINSDIAFEKVTSSQSGNLITIKADDKSCNDQVIPLVNDNSNIVSFANLLNNQSDLTSTIELSMLTDNYTYELSLSQDNLSLYVTVYKNSLSSIKIGTNSYGDYITLTGMSTLKPAVSKEGSLTYIDLPYTTNGIGDINHAFTSAKYLNLIYSMNLGDKTRLVVSQNDGYETQVFEEGNSYTIYFKLPGVTVPSPQANTETPAVIDKSKYQVVIPKPADLNSSMITDEDYYDNHKFVIRIHGDYTAFYQSKTISNSSGTINNINVALNSNNETEITFSTTKLQGYEYTTDNDNIYVRVGNPRDIYKNIVVLDAGHGGKDNGTQQFGTKEKDINLNILYTVGKKYFNSDPSKLKVYYTRSSDVFISLSDRAAYAEKMGADLFVSLHMNAVTQNTDAVSGTEIYYSSSNNTPNSTGLTSKKLADTMLGNLTGTLGMNKRGVKAKDYYVVHRNTVPAILIELGYLSNTEDQALLTDEAFQDKAAQTIYDTLLGVFETYPTGR